MIPKEHQELAKDCMKTILHLAELYNIEELKMPYWLCAIAFPKEEILH